MCSAAFRSFLKALPKCEHHMHLEGALTPPILFKLAAKNNIELPADDEAFASPEALVQRYSCFTSLDDFLHYYYIGMSVLVDASDFEALAWDYFEHAHEDGVVHAEVFFDPQAHLSRGISYETVLSGFNAARKRAEEQLHITNELICCFLRHLPPADCEATFALPEVQQHFRDGSVIGIGLDSSEIPFPPHLFKEAPSDYIHSALETLSIDRIDHGIRLVDDAALLARVAAEGKMVTVCPVSNLLLRCVPDIASLPIRAFLAAGVSFSINSDDPAYFGGKYVLDNYIAVQEAFGLTVAEWGRICEGSIRGSWCGEARKEELLGLLRQVIAAAAARETQ